MKKRKEHKISPHKAKRAKASRPSLLPSSQPPSRFHLTKYRRWLLKAVAIFSGVLGIVASVAGFWGPFWPTAPTFSPGFPSAGLPLEIPFNVTNSSVLFPIEGLKIACWAEQLKTDRGTLFTQNVFHSGISESLQPAETRSYACRFHEVIGLRKGEGIVEAEIKFLAEYESRIPWKTLAESTSGTFTLNTQTMPPQWMHGTPLH